jgi:hypothetical protein
MPSRNARTESISWLAEPTGLLPRISHLVRSGHAEGSGRRFGWGLDVCRPDNVARRAPLSSGHFRMCGADVICHSAGVMEPPKLAE